MSPQQEQLLSYGKTNDEIRKAFIGKRLPNSPCVIQAGAH